jgi:curved DNA-binding protein CbpA
VTRAYLRLGLDPIASPLEVRRSYRSLSRTLHPDKVGEDEEKLKEVRMNEERSDEIKPVTLRNYRGSTEPCC